MMVMHHYTTVILMVNCLAHRQYRFGIATLLLHDMTDSLVNIMRLVREIEKWKELILPIYICFMIVWVYTRNLVFNVELIYPLLSKNIPKMIRTRDYPHVFATTGLLIITMLNTYWLFGLIHAGYIKIVKKSDNFILEETQKKDSKFKKFN